MKPAAQYLRMSTEHQNYSLDFQTAHNAAFAAAHGFQVVRDYVDAGVSGLSLKGRQGLRDLLADVMAGDCGYGAILVYDVSRWGRFQDPDQAAHYEFLCREAGVPVLYTAEPFSAEGGLTASIVKQLKRAMAAEYSRELSAKTGQAQRGLMSLGFWVGGPPGYGLRRLAVTRARTPQMQMEAGQQKAVRGQRTLLTPGPAHEVETVRRIYRDFLTGGLRIPLIARRLNAEGVPSEAGARWTAHRVRQVLTNEKYAGVLVGRKSEGALGVRRPRPRAHWLRVPDAVEPIVSRATFDLVQAQFRRPKPRGASDEELLAELRRVLADHGELSCALIDRHPAAHCADVYKKRFGGALNAYRRVGFEPTRRQVAAHEKVKRHRPWAHRTHPQLEPDEAWRRLEAHFARLGQVSCRTIEEDPDLPYPDWYRRRFGSMREIYHRLGHTPSDRQRRHFRDGAGPGEALTAGRAAIARPPQVDNLDLDVPASVGSPHAEPG